MARKLARLRPGTAVQVHAEPVVGIDRREDARVVSGGAEMFGERIDVTRHTAGVAP